MAMAPVQLMNVALRSRADRLRSRVNRKTGICVGADDSKEMAMLRLASVASRVIQLG